MHNVTMAAKHSSIDRDLAIWERVFVPDPKHITADQANYLLDVHFPKADLKRIDDLSAGAAKGTLTEEEAADLDRYIHVGHLLSILKAKVRRKLRKGREAS